MADLFGEADPLALSTYTLSGLELYNWGSFDGRHNVEIDRAGTAIIGSTGSGKTTLVDALLTLLVAQPRYNFASTGGHEHDRNLVSYIRGVSGAGTDIAGDNRHVARAGRTVTGISARFENAEGSVNLMAVFWIDTTSSANADRKDLWLFVEDESTTLDQILTIHADDGARGVKQFVRENRGTSAFERKRPFLARARSFFGVGENAFNLLNRAAGLKQLSSMDEIFRELVLDDHAAFGRAAEVIAEFENLKEIRSELELARRQKQSLDPIVRVNKRFTETDVAVTETRQLLDALPRWFAELGLTVWMPRLEALVAQIRTSDLDIEAVEDALVTLGTSLDSAHEAYIRVGGGRADQTQEQIGQQKDLLHELRRNARDYERTASALGLETRLDRSTFEANLGIIQERLPEYERLLAERDDAYIDAAVILKQCTDELADLEARLKQARPARILIFQGTFRYSVPAWPRCCKHRRISCRSLLNWWKSRHRNQPGAAPLSVPSVPIGCGLSPPVITSRRRCAGSTAATTGYM